MYSKITGFICPVHTPDGTPCGLLNHLARGCHVATRPSKAAPIESLLNTLGVIGSESGEWSVWVEGRVVGWVSASRAKKAANALRVLKAQEGWDVEVCLLEAEEGLRGQWPGLFVFVGAGRLLRRVMHLPTRRTLQIGTLEQVHLHVAAVPEDLDPADPPSHLELAKTDFLSNLACLIPMPDCNQSPRNMYQCQVRYCRRPQLCNIFVL
jgi:DNA-directed RNA polymerase I subunit RPA2